MDLHILDLEPWTVADERMSLTRGMDRQARGFFHAAWSHLRNQELPQIQKNQGSGPGERRGMPPQASELGSRDSNSNMVGALCSGRDSLAGGFHT